MKCGLAVVALLGLFISAQAHYVCHYVLLNDAVTAPRDPTGTCAKRRYDCLRLRSFFLIESAHTADELSYGVPARAGCFDFALTTIAQHEMPGATGTDCLWDAGNATVEGKPLNTTGDCFGINAISLFHLGHGSSIVTPIGATTVCPFAEVDGVKVR